MNPAHIRNLLRQGRLEAALDALVDAGRGTSLESTLINLSGQYHRLKEQRNQGTLDAATQSLRENQIQQALLSTLEELETELPPEAFSHEPVPTDSTPGQETSASGGSSRKEKASPGPHLFPSIAGLGLMVGVALLLVFVPCPSSSQYAVFRIVLAMALAGFAAVIPGFLTFKYKQALSAGGALAVFALAYLIDPAARVSSDDCHQPFDLTIFIEDAQGRSVLRNQGQLILTLPNDKRQEPLDGDGKATFSQLPAALSGDSSRLTLQAQGWQFTNGQPSLSLSLAQASQTLIVERDASLCCLSGSVRDSDGFVAGARVSVKGDYALTDSVGHFELELSEQNQREEVTLTVSKEGYGIWTGRGYPGSEREADILLRR